MGQRSLVPDTAEAAASIVGLLCMSATFPSADRHAASDCSMEGTALPSLGTKLSVEVAVRRVAGGALREVASQER